LGGEKGGDERGKEKKKVLWRVHYFLSLTTCQGQEGGKKEGEKTDREKKGGKKGGRERGENGAGSRVDYNQFRADK